MVNVPARSVPLPQMMLLVTVVPAVALSPCRRLLATVQFSMVKTPDRPSPSPAAMVLFPTIRQFRSRQVPSDRIPPPSGAPQLVGILLLEMIES